MIGVAKYPTTDCMSEVKITVKEGRGHILLTGNLTTSAANAAMNALHVVRHNARRYGVWALDVHSHDVEIAFPEIPLDGPSAGLATAVAVVSAFLHKPVDEEVAFTGALNYNGAVLTVGGLEEKLAHVGGKCLVFPELNASFDAGAHTVVPVGHLDQALSIAFGE